MSRYATHKARRRFERRPCEGRRRSAARPWTSPSPHFPCSIIFFVSLSLCSSFVWTLKRTRQRRNGWPHGKPNGEAEIEFKKKKENLRRMHRFERKRIGGGTTSASPRRQSYVEKIPLRMDRFSLFWFIFWHRIVEGFSSHPSGLLGFLSDRIEFSSALERGLNWVFFPNWGGKS